MRGHDLESLSTFLQKASQRYGVALEGKQQSPSPVNMGDPTQIEPQSAEQTITKQPLVGLDVAWCDAMRIFQSGQMVHGIVTGWNRGGLLVRWNDLQGFVPASQLKEVPVFESDDARDEKLARWVGEELRLKVIELDRSRNRLVFSERATIWGPKDGERLLTEVTPGETRCGYVSNLCDFGAFVDLGGVDGLIHISELSWGRVNHPQELLAIGQRLDVYVISVDRDNRRVALSLKRLHPDPWTIVEQKYHVGQIVPATITNLVDFGAFARIEDGLEGLVHISELSEAEIKHPSEAVVPGDQVQVRILRIDSANHRLGLSIRLASEEPLAQDQSPSKEAEWGAGGNFLY